MCHQQQRQLTFVQHLVVENYRLWIPINFCPNPNPILLQLIPRLEDQITSVFVFFCLYICLLFFHFYFLMRGKALKGKRSYLSSLGLCLQLCMRYTVTIAELGHHTSYSVGSIYFLYLHTHFTGEKTGSHNRNKPLKAIFKEKQCSSFITEPVL